MYQTIGQHKTLNRFSLAGNYHKPPRRSLFVRLCGLVGAVASLIKKGSNHA